MTDLGPRERQLLTSLRAADEPTGEDRARVRSRVLIELAAGGAAAAVASQSPAATAAGSAASAAAGAGAAAGTASVAPPAAAAAVASAGTWKIAAAVAVVVGGVGGGAWIATTSERPAAPAPVVQSAAPSKAPLPVMKPVPPALTQETERPPEQVEASSEPPPSTPRAPRSGKAAQRAVSPPPPAANADALDRELSLLENAQRALKRGDPTAALDTLREHESKHPSGALKTERDGVLAIALCRSDRVSEGQRVAHEFLARNPKSPLATRVRAACFKRGK